MWSVSGTLIIIIIIFSFLVASLFHLSCSHAFLPEAASSFPTALSYLAPCTAQTHSLAAFLLTWKAPTWGAPCAPLPSHRGRRRKQQGLFPRGGTGCLPPPCGELKLEAGRTGLSVRQHPARIWGGSRGLRDCIWGRAGILLDCVPDSRIEFGTISLRCFSLPFGGSRENLGLALI